MATVQKTPPTAQRPEARSAKPAAASGSAQKDRIAARAYEIWLANGRPDGRDQEHWFQAERELRGTGAPAARGPTR